MDQALKQENMPSGGIAGFIYTDEEIKLLEDKELKDLYGQNGIAQFKTIGKEMANFGRYGDDTIAHVETGELIVPRALIEGNPKLKESIFGHLRDLGIDDPERYVVGTSKNSLNPETGLPEFFLKKLFKKATKAISSIGKGVSKALKGVGKALKKVAPIVVPLALNYFLPGLGAVYSGALGAGITSLMQGAKLEDAFKSALVGGATGAITAGFTGKGSFGSNIAADVGKGTTNIRQAFTQGSFDPLTTTDLPSLRDFDADPSNNTGIDRPTIKKETLPSLEPDSSTLASAGSTDGLQQANLIQKPTPTLMDDAGNFYATQADFVAGNPLPPELRSPSGDIFTTDPIIKPNVISDASASNLTASEVVPDYAPGAPVGAYGSESLAPPSTFEQIKDFGSKAGDLVFGTEPTQSQIIARAGEIQTEALAQNLTITGEQALSMAEKELAPSFLRTYGPSTALGVAGLTGAGAFDAPEEEPLPDTETGRDVFAEDPDRFRVKDVGVRTAAIPAQTNTSLGTPLQTGTSYGFDYNPYLFSNRPFQTVADGGEIFPRRNGGIGPREGTPGKDSVRAMLMPGEFVMTTNAVKGLGNGNLDKGIKNMYSVMSKLEKRGKAMA